VTTGVAVPISELTSLTLSYIYFGATVGAMVAIGGESPWK
jgi:hypothetical protein